MSHLPILPSAELRQCHKCGNHTLRDISFVPGSVEVTETCFTCGYRGTRQLHRRQVQPGSKKLGRFVREPTRYAHEVVDPMADLRAKWQETIP
jgi:hypothetical protein